MKTPATLSALAAARKVLHTARKPLHYKEVTKRAMAQGLWRPKGKTPWATMNAQLTVNIAKKGPSSPFCHVGPGLFALNSKPQTQFIHHAATARKKVKPRPRITGTRPLVLGFLERIASSAFSEFPRQITDLVHGKHGVYALYKGDHLYSVGLATNLRTRIKQHLNDKHAGKWNRFSLYLVRKVEHIKELETLILRIADPTGNSTRGVLPGAENLWSPLLSTIRDEQDRQIQSIFDIKKKPISSKSKHSNASRRPPPRSAPEHQGRTPTLAQYLSANTPLRAGYKGQTLTANVDRNGFIRFAGNTYTSPSLAGAAAVKRKSCNGWTFWKYERAPGHWAKLTELREK